MAKTLTSRDHSREFSSNRYVYPVVSRRAAGVSVGINLNTNNACNWRCIYCQVPSLVRGKPEHIDLFDLEKELYLMLSDIKEGAFFEKFVPPHSRRLNDIALSGNGEPTASTQLRDVIGLVAKVKGQVLKNEEIKTILITNGSLLHSGENPHILKDLAAQNGEVWFKLDRVTPGERKLVNSVDISLNRVRKNLALSAKSCPTWIQTCFFKLDGMEPGENERSSYLSFLKECVDSSVEIAGVMIYNPTRASHQPEAQRISPVGNEWISGICKDIESTGLEVKFSL